MSPTVNRQGICRLIRKRVVLLAGLACGLLNGIIVVYGRIQPIIVTLATGAVYTGLALFIRPISGGHVSEELSDAVTYDFMGIVPTSLVLLFAVVLVIWVPFKGSLLGRGIYAVGSSESAAYMSGVKNNRSKLVGYTLAGFFASLGGLFIGLQTLTGDANIGFSYTLNSIASVVIGGTLLSGGVGGVMGSIIGAFVLRTVNSLMFFAGAPPLAQPLFEGQAEKHESRVSANGWLALARVILVTRRAEFGRLEPNV